MREKKKKQPPVLISVFLILVCRTRCLSFFTVKPHTTHTHMRASPVVPPSPSSFSISFCPLIPSSLITLFPKLCQGVQACIHPLMVFFSFMPQRLFPGTSSPSLFPRHLFPEVNALLYILPYLVVGVVLPSFCPPPPRLLFFL